MQHKGFGKELRALQSSTIVWENEYAALIVSELKHLAESKSQNKPHPREKRMRKPLAEVSCLTIRAGGSARVYFWFDGTTIWLLRLDANKRRTPVTEGLEESLQTRLNEIRGELLKTKEGQVRHKP